LKFELFVGDNMETITNAQSDNSEGTATTANQPPATASIAVIRNESSHCDLIWKLTTALLQDRNAAEYLANPK
jgi:hypothetical protein